MKGRSIPYSAEELEWLEANRTMLIGDYHRAFVVRFGRTDVSAVNLNSLRKRKRWSTGRTGRFEPGQEPFNKGKPMPFHPNSAATRFQKGNRGGQAARLYKQIGAERLSKNGYLERKIHDGMPMQSRWRAVHLIRWEEINGPVPNGHALKCLGDKGDTDPSNWTLVSRALLPRLNGRFGRGYDAAPQEVKPTILTIAKLEHQARIRRKGSA